ncbi:MAG: hypothetical protein R3Y56_07360 [Akkermansia sp.]
MYNPIMRFLTAILLLFVTSLSSLARLSWTECLRSSINEIQAQGAGHYSVKDDAHEALARSFRWKGRAIYDKSEPRPSFCSGAVYVALLNALIKWEAAQGKAQFSKEAWQALFPLRYQDGERAWGWANANGPGLALLIHQLGAGYSFTDWDKARPFDVIKMWWTHEIGGKERGHIAFFIKDEGDKVLIWSSNQSLDGQQGGYGLRYYPKSSIKRALFTRITKPQAFEGASQIKFNPWLHGLLRQSSSWADALRAIKC